MGRWFRFYDDVLDDPKAQKLSDAAFRGWVNILCLASKSGGTLEQPLENVAFSLRKSVPKTRELLQVLLSAGLLETVENGWKPHNWDIRQFKSDVSTERVRRFRKRHETVSETVPESDTESEQRQKEETLLRSVIPKPKKRSRFQLPENFPTQSDFEWSNDLWLRHGRADLCAAAEDEAAKFRDHHSGKLTASADWPASWRTWARNAIKFSNGGRNGRQPTAHENFAAGALAAAMENGG